MRWWPPWRRRRDEPDASPDTELRAELQRTRMDLDERSEALERVHEDLRRERGQTEGRARESADVEVAGLIDVIGTPLTQLVTLEHLRAEGTVEPRAGDVLAVAMRLVRALEDRGIAAAGTVGARESFDPDRHEPVGAGTIEAGRSVIVRFVGFTHGTRVLRKAGVEPAEEGAG